MFHFNERIAFDMGQNTVRVFTSVIQHEEMRVSPEVSFPYRLLICILKYSKKYMYFDGHSS